jgi:hypothetical protein
LLVLLSVGWAGLFLNKLAPEHTSADMLLFSIMSLQHRTVFYWGQDRIINLIPLIAHGIADPGLNLLAIMLLHATLFFGVLVQLAVYLVRAQRGGTWQTILVVSAMVLFYLASLKNAFAFDLLAIHIEYTGSYFLVLAAFSVLARERVGMVRGSLVAVAIVLAVGLNPSVILAIAAIGIGVSLTGDRKRRILRAGMALVLAGIAIVGWRQLAPGGTPSGYYLEFDFGALQKAVPATLKQISVSLRDQPAAAIMLAAALIVSTILLPGVSRLRLWLAVVFAIAWLVVFSGNKWVAMNNYTYRYFASIYYISAGIVGLAASLLAARIPRWFGWTVLAVTFFAVGAWLVAPIAGWDDFAVFKRIARAGYRPPTTGISIHAGDYWYVWPAVMRDEILGVRSIGVTIRSESNRGSTVAALAGQLENGAVVVNCWHETDAACLSQVRTYADSAAVISVNRMSADYSRLTLSGLPWGRR